MLKVISLIGLVTFLLLAWLISLKRRNFPWRTVFTGLFLQVCLAALLISETPVSAELYNFADGIANRILEFAGEGTRLVFGPLADSQVLGKAFGEQNGFILAITIGGTIILVAVLSSLLYHLRILQRSLEQWLGPCAGCCGPAEVKASAAQQTSSWVRRRLP